MTYSQAKVQGQWSVGSEDRVETNRRCHSTYVVFTDHISKEGNAIASIRLFICPSICFHSIFETRQTEVTALPPMLMWSVKTTYDE